ncbi:hypothetical protein C8R44DRAFT_681070 [Mycena epipterygia]|nr:hypothetical protein C8R44DRAFT_681070 [Mycena epipterygia]
MSTVISMPQPVHPSHKAPADNASTYPPSYAPNEDPVSSKSKPPELVPQISRTPSPTPSEDGVRRKRSWRELLRIYLILAIIIVVIALIEAYHQQIVAALRPVTNWLHSITAGWLIPIVVLIALSFPPLFGHELVAMLCGLVWGLGAGFGIVAAGTILGEIGTFYAFKFCCHARGEKMELRSIPYGTLSRVVREGGLRIAIIVRYSAIPPHFTTAVFATCGMPFWVFLTAAIVSLPKQLVLVYVGVALASTHAYLGDSKSNKVQKIILGVTIPITVLALIYIRRLMAQARPAVVYARRKARQAKLQAEAESV